MDNMTNHQIESAFSGHANIQYWTSFEDHKKRILQDIEEYENDITESKRCIEELKEDYDKVCKDEKEFTTSTYEPSYRFSESEILENPEFCEKAKQLLKLHELTYHKDLVGNFIVCDNNGHLQQNGITPTYHFIGSGNNVFKIKYILCCDCLKDYIQHNEVGKPHHMMCIDRDIGSSF